MPDSATSKDLCAASYKGRKVAHPLLWYQPLISPNFSRRLGATQPKQVSISL